MSVLVTHFAPDFTKPAVLPDGSFNETYNFRTAISGKYAVLFFYPLDFTFVCPSEISPIPTGWRSSVNAM